MYSSAVLGKNGRIQMYSLAVLGSSESMPVKPLTILGSSSGMRIYSPLTRKQFKTMFIRQTYNTNIKHS